MRMTLLQGLKLMNTIIFWLVTNPSNEMSAEVYLSWAVQKLTLSSTTARTEHSCCVLQASNGQKRRKTGGELLPNTNLAVQTM